MDLLLKQQQDELFEEQEFDVRKMYPLIAKTAWEAGWSDPIMDEYDHYDDYLAMRRIPL